jgi:TolB protein
MKRVLNCVVLWHVVLVGSVLLIGNVEADRIGTISFASYIRSPDLYLIDSTGKNLRELTTDDRNKRSPTWSPDRRFFAYQSKDDRGLEIYVMDVENKTSRQLTNHPDRDLSPVWAPNGKWIAFVSDRAGDLDIYRIDVDGSNLQRLTNRGDNQNPAWSPDSQWIAYDSYQGGDHRPGGMPGRHFLYVMTANGARSKQLVEERNLSGCTWSPDGKHIAFAAGNIGGEGANIHIIDANGNNRRTLTRVGPNAAANHPAWSPDSEWIAYFFVVLPVLNPGQAIPINEALQNNVISVIDTDGKDAEQSLEATRRLSTAPVWVPEVFFPVSPHPD